MFQLWLSWAWFEQGKEYRMTRAILDEIAAERIEALLAEDDETMAEAQPDLEEQGD